MRERRAVNFFVDEQEKKDVSIFNEPSSSSSLSLGSSCFLTSTFLGVVLSRRFLLLLLLLWLSL